MNGPYPQTPYPNQTPPRPPGGGGGCFLKGCLVVIVAVMCLGVAIGGLGWYVSRGVIAFFTHNQVAIRKVADSELKYEAALRKIAAFNQTIASGQPAVLTLTADDLNAIVARDSRFAEVRGRVFLSIVNNQIVAETSVPLNEDKSFSTGQQWFFNARVVLDASYASGDFTFQLARFESLDGKQPPAVLMGFARGFVTGFNQEFNKGFHDHPERNEDLRQLTSQLRTVILKDNTIVATSVDHPKPAAAPAPSPVAESPDPR